MSATLPTRRFFIETWGCQMNELDSQRMAGQLMQEGLLPTRDPAHADLILLNSCSVREKAEHKVYSRLGEYRRFKSESSGVRIGLTGCVAQQAGERALRRVPDLDFVLGTGRVEELRNVLTACDEGQRVVCTGFPESTDYTFDTISREHDHKGMITVIEGCNQRCTFCIVPQTRGAERCRPLAPVLQEVRHLVEYGFLEIELLGQTVNHWRDPIHDLDFADLLEQVAAIPGVARLRFITSYPRDFSQRMIEVFASRPNISRYLHLPVQSGSNRVLKRMGRRYTRDDYLELVGRLREFRPDVALSSDLIVGFPGETDADFAQTLDLVQSARFASIYAFKYSPRPGTAAPRIGPPVEAAVADERLQRLFAMQEKIGRKLNEQLVGTVQEVLVTGQGNRPGTLRGRTDCHRVVHFPTPEDSSLHSGTLAAVEITEALPHSLRGRAA